MRSGSRAVGVAGLALGKHQGRGCGKPSWNISGRPEEISIKPDPRRRLWRGTLPQASPHARISEKCRGRRPSISSRTLSQSRATPATRPTGSMPGRYDRISFHHSLEHMPERGRRAHAWPRSMLIRGGVLLIRFRSQARWRGDRRTELAQLDPPRQSQLAQPRPALPWLPAMPGRNRDPEHDSDGFQFWASHLPTRAAPLDRSGIAAHGVAT